MLRKIILAVTAAAALGATALAPSSASAWGFHPYWHGYYHGWYGPRVVFAGPGYDGCMVRTWVQTPGGPMLRWVNRCY
jgi:hypothetical protein